MLVNVHAGNEYTMHCIKEGKTIRLKTGNVSVFDACYVNGQNYIIQSFDNLYSAAKCAQYYKVTIKINIKKELVVLIDCKLFFYVYGYF